MSGAYGFKSEKYVQDSGQEYTTDFIKMSLSPVIQKLWGAGFYRAPLCKQRRSERYAKKQHRAIAGTGIGSGGGRDQDDLRHFLVKEVLVLFIKAGSVVLLLQPGRECGEEAGGEL